MTQEERELLLKDISSRLPYGVKVQRLSESESAFELYSIYVMNTLYIVLLKVCQIAVYIICLMIKVMKKKLIYQPKMTPVIMETILLI